MASLSYLTADVWRYENAGTADGLTTSGTTLTNLPATRSKTGTAFYQTTRAKCFNLPATTDIWIKFDVYYNGTQRWRAYNGVGGITAWNRSNTVANALGFFDTNGTQVHYVTSVCKPNTLQTVLLHMQAGTTDGIIETWVDDVFIYRYTGNVNGGNAFADVFLQSDGSGTFFSSVTISNSQRGLVIREQVSADTRRIVVRKETARADTFRQVVKTETVAADLLRRLREVSRADTCRHVKRTERAIARTVIRVPHVLNYVLQSRPQTFKAASKFRLLADDNPLSLVNTFKDYGVTAINITLSEKTLSDDFRFDIASRSMDINETVQGWLLDYPFHFLIEETTQTDLVQSVKGRYSVDDLLYKWFILTLDTITTSSALSSETEETTEETVEIVPKAIEIVTKIAHYLELTPDVRIDNFTPSNFRNGSALTYSDVLNNLFGWTSRVPHKQINVFIRDNALHCIQRGKETAIFDITDLPHSRPTVNKKFIRTLCYNPNKTDADDDSSSGSSSTDETETEGTNLFSGTIFYDDPHFTLSYTYNNGLLAQEISTSNTGDGLSWNGIPYCDEKGKVATLARSNTTYHYVSYTTSTDDTGSKNYGQVSAADGANLEETLFQNQTKGITNVNHEYYFNFKHNDSSTTQNDGDTITKKISETTTDYHYETLGDELYLFAEYETTKTVEYVYNTDGDVADHWEKVSDETHTRETRHIPAGNGWYAQTVYLDGEPQGANLSQGAPSNRVSPYTVNQIQNNFSKSTFAINGAGNENPSAEASAKEPDELSMIVDDSFPVKETAFKDTLNEALRWLNRKVQETVNVDLIAKVDNGVPSIQHIVDFTERVKLDGAEYFLVSNRISFTPRKLIQKLQLIRWY